MYAYFSSIPGKGLKIERTKTLFRKSFKWIRHALKINIRNLKYYLGSDIDLLWTYLFSPPYSTFIFILLHLKYSHSRLHNTTGNYEPEIPNLANHNDPIN